MAQRKIAVTGSTGFIGSKLVDRLTEQGNTVYVIDREFKSIDCDIIYHLACPSTTSAINADPVGVMDTIIDATRKAIDVCPSALFVNASSYGAGWIDIDQGPQNAYNIAKRCMEVYLEYAKGPYGYINYRLPAVYGPNMYDDFFIKKCVDGTAYKPTDPDRLYYIAHIDDVVEAMSECKQILIEELTLGQIYELFNSGRRGLHRPTFS
jgi:nucleoside-diphosphate-sugar epimerase